MSIVKEKLAQNKIWIKLMAVKVKSNVQIEIYIFLWVFVLLQYFLIFFIIIFIVNVFSVRVVQRLVMIIIVKKKCNYFYNVNFQITSMTCNLCAQTVKFKRIDS